MLRTVFAAALLFCAASALLWAAPAWAAEPIGLVTGPKTGTYIAIGRDVAAVAAKAGVEVEVKPSEGSVDNIKRINSKENAGLGIVQSDVLGFLARSQKADTRRMAADLRMVMPLYQEEVHVLARKEVTDMRQLNGKRVVAGEDGSGHMLTAVNIMALLGVAPAQIIRSAPPQGVLALLEGQADAVFFVGGKPVKIFQNLEQLKSEDGARYQQFLNDVHFLPLSDAKLLEEYHPAELTPEDYGFIHERVPTVSATAVLVAHDFSPSSSHPRPERCESVRKLAHALKTALPQLKESRHPKWKEVSGGIDTPLWKKDSCAWGKPADAKKTEKKKTKPAKKRSRLTPDQRRVAYQR